MPAVNERTGQTDERRQMPSSGIDLPLLHLSENRFSSDGHDAPFSNGLPFPMLQMVDPRRNRVPFFVPPEEIVGRNNNNQEMSPARAGLQTARSEPQTGRSGVHGSSQQSVELLQLQPCLSEADSVLVTDSRQVLR